MGHELSPTSKSTTVASLQAELQITKLETQLEAKEEELEKKDLALKQRDLELQNAHLKAENEHLKADSHSQRAATSVAIASSEPMVEPTQDNTISTPLVESVRTPHGPAALACAHCRCAVLHSLRYPGGRSICIYSIWYECF